MVVGLGVQLVGFQVDMGAKGEISLGECQIDRFRSWVWVHLKGFEVVIGSLVVLQFSR